MKRYTKKCHSLLKMCLSRTRKERGIIGVDKVDKAK